MTDETLKITITFGKTYAFFLRMIGFAEERELRQKMLGLSDQEQTDKEYEFNVKLLKDLSTDKPKGLFDERPENLQTADSAQPRYEEDFRTPAELIDAFFAERTILKERVAYFAARGYMVRLQPSENFL